MHNHFNKNLNVKELIEKHKPEKIVELGADKGGNTVQLLTLAKVLTITDNSVPSGENRESLARAIANGNLEWVQGVSFNELKNYDDNSMTFVSVDTDHNYMTLKLELDELYRTVKTGGIVVIHDVEKFRGINKIHTAFRNQQKYGNGKKYDMNLMSSEGPGYTSALLEQVEEGRWKIIKWVKESCGAAAIEKL